MMPDLINQQTLFDQHFSADNLKDYLATVTRKLKHQYAGNSAMEAKKPHQHLGIAESELDDYLATISKKCHAKSFRFSPYHEKLMLKGKGKLPRAISVPCVRDKIVLRQITECLQSLYPTSAHTPRGSLYVKRIVEVLSQASDETLWVYRGDIQKFYDEIPRDQLLAQLSETIQVPELMALINHAMQTPTVPKRTQRKDYAHYKTTKGVPQGLSFSGLLANVFLQPVDQAVQQVPGIEYFRFVDDILILGSEQQVKAARDVLEAELSQRQLKLHTQGTDKEHLNRADQPFAYLGYTVAPDLISVRASSVERVRLRITSFFSDYRKALKEIDPEIREQLDSVFIEQFNIMITGAKQGNKNYGWLFYYRYITDHNLLHQLDHLVRQLLKRHHFTDEQIEQVKKFSRAWFEINYQPNSNYIHRYDELLKFDFDEEEKPKSKAVTQNQVIAKEVDAVETPQKTITESEKEGDIHHLIELLRLKAKQNLIEDGYST
ncbi:MAG TPA: reverse transcriptase domain-containing protein [Thiotrichales bacterium]|nr:reverse transcriptase domain-containing protein [Thiotrichales bacterium]